MNERIKELALQAGDYVNSVYTPPVRSKTPGKIWEDGHIGWHEQFHEKFAELIVRECAAVAGKFVHDNKYKEGGISEFWLKDEIKEHFGVE